MSILADLIADLAFLEKSAPAIEYKEAWYNWGTLCSTISNIQDSLEILGLGEDSRIGVVMKNHPNVIASILAVLGIKATVISINPMSPIDVLTAEVHDVTLPVVIGSKDGFPPDVLKAFQTTGTAIIEISDVLGSVGFRNGFNQFDKTRVRLKEPNVALEMFSSGTTGKPKRIPLYREAFEKSFQNSVRGMVDLDARPRLKARTGLRIQTNPMSHIGGLWSMLVTILCGRKLALFERFNVDEWRRAIVRHRPKVTGAVPTALRMILDANIPKEDFSSLTAILTGAQALDVEISDTFLERYDLPILQSYGATEFSGAVAGWSLKDFRKYYQDKKSSVGKFHLGVEGRIVDAGTDNVLSPGVEGVLEMRAPQFGNKGQWLRTTDRAIIDKDDFLYICGRADNAIIRGGFKVHPDDVVRVFNAHPAIRETVVVGVADRRLGSVPVAAIILNDRSVVPTIDELKLFAKKTLKSYQIPDQFIFVDDVPRTASLKPSFVEVQRLFEKKDA